MKIILKIFLFFTVSSHSFAISDEQCHPEIDNAKEQYIIGYGSLINEASKRDTENDVSDGIPVTVNGFARGWWLHSLYEPGTTFLGVIPQESASFNGVIFKITSNSALQSFDKREVGYCRTRISNTQIKNLIDKRNFSGDIWIYTLKHEKALPNKNYMIVQSYVDIVLHGCIDIEKKYNLEGFANLCVSTTQDWSKEWLENDRIYPRRPYTHEPYALIIDSLMSRL